MKVVLTEGTSRLGVRLADALAQHHSVVVLEGAFRPHAGKWSPAAAAELGKRLHDLTVLVHIPPLLWESPATSPEEEQEQLDVGTRQLYDLLGVAVQQGVKSILYVGSLSVMDGYPKEYVVTEYWRPSPMPNSRDLGLYLGELVVREFARQHRTSALCLRVDEAVWEGDPALVDSLVLLCVQAVESKPGEGVFLVRHVGVQTLRQHGATAGQSAASDEVERR